MNKKEYYQERINKSLDYINRHLSENIKIEQLAQISHFSPYHFQRIYKSLMGESPYETLLRLRLEKSVFLLKHRPSLSVSEVSFQSGFPSAENFSRQFKSRFKIAPSIFKKNKELQNSRIYQEPFSNDVYHCTEESRKEGVGTFDVEIEKLSNIPIAFIRGFFGEDGSVLVKNYLHLIEWATSKSIDFKGGLKRFGMSIDNIEVTPTRQYRYDFAIKIDKKTDPENIIEIGEIPEGKYATIHCQGDISDVAKAWDFLYKIWLPESGYLPADYPAIEEFVQGPEEIGWERFNIKCRIPVLG